MTPPRSLITSEFCKMQHVYIECDGGYLRWKLGPDNGVSPGSRLTLSDKYPTIEDYIQGVHCTTNFTSWKGLPPGAYHPRVWRPGDEWRKSEYDDGDPILERARTAYSLIFDDLLAIFRNIEPEGNNLDTYGHTIRNVLLLSCMEIEAGWTAVLKANGLIKDRYSTNDYVKLCDPMLLKHYTVTLQRFPELGEIHPFHAWNCASPTQSLHFYDAYNATKHDRESNFHRATLRLAVEAFAATLVMFTAQFGQPRYLCNRECLVTLRNDFDPHLNYLPIADSNPSNRCLTTPIPLFP